MMLSFATSTGQTNIWIRPNQSISIGRKSIDSQVQFEVDDVSLSRKHCIVQFKGSLTLTDLKSKYGTFVNNIKVTDPVELKPGDRVKLGLYKTYFVVETLKICTSGLKAPQTDSMKSLGLEISSDWSSDCTHLVMIQATVTLKLLLALLDGKPIVSLDWIQSLKKSLVIPPPGEFIPSLARDSSILPAHFHPKNQSDLFKGKTVYALVEDSTCSLIMQHASGSFKLIGHDQESLQAIVKLIDENSTDNCLYTPPLHVSPSLVDALKTLMRSHSLKFISQEDIANAVLNSSWSPWCLSRKKKSRVVEAFQSAPCNGLDDFLEAIHGKDNTSIPSSQAPLNPAPFLKTRPVLKPLPNESVEDEFTPVQDGRTMNQSIPHQSEVVQDTLIDQEFEVPFDQTYHDPYEQEPMGDQDTPMDDVDLKAPTVTTPRRGSLTSRRVLADPSRGSTPLPNRSGIKVPVTPLVTRVTMTKSDVQNLVKHSTLKRKAQQEITDAGCLSQERKWKSDQVMQSKEHDSKPSKYSRVQVVPLMTSHECIFEDGVPNYKTFKAKVLVKPIVFKTQ